MVFVLGSWMWLQYCGIAQHLVIDASLEWGCFCNIPCIIFHITVLYFPINCIISVCSTLCGQFKGMTSAIIHVKHIAAHCSEYSITYNALTAVQFTDITLAAVL